MWQQIKALNEQRGEKLTAMRAILRAAQDEKRDLTAEEKSRFDALEAQAERIKDQLTRAESVYKVEKDADAFNQGRSAAINAPVGDSGGGQRVIDVRRKDFGLETRAGDMWKPDPLYRDLDRPLSFGKFIKGIATGDWSDATAEARSLSIGGPAGVLVPTPLFNAVIDYARNTAVCFKAGVRTIPMESATLKLARLTGDVGAGWVAENAIIGQNDSTFDSLTLNAKKCACLVKMSVELAEDAEGIDQVVTTSIGKSLALALDSAILYGNGSGATPTGIANSSGIGTMASIGTPTDYSNWSKAIQTVRTANFEPNAQINSPRTAGHLERLVNSLGDPLGVPTSVEKLPSFITNQIPINSGGGSNESQSFVGAFTECLVGMRNQLFLEVSREAGDSSTSAFTNGQVWIRAYLRADVALAHSAAFVFMSGITGT